MTENECWDALSDIIDSVPIMLIPGQQGSGNLLVQACQDTLQIDLPGSGEQDLTADFCVICTII